MLLKKIEQILSSSLNGVCRITNCQLLVREMSRTIGAGNCYI